VVLQRLGESRVGLKPRSQHHGGLHGLTTHIVGHAGHGGFHHRLVGQKRTLHFEGSDAVTGTLDQIIHPAHKPIVSVLVAPSLVSGVIKSVFHGIGGLFRLIQIFVEQADDGLLIIQADANLTLLAGPDFIAPGIQKHDVPTGNGLADGPGLGLHKRERGDLQGGLGLAVALVDGQSGDALPLLEHALVEQFARRGAMLELGKIKGGQILADQKPIHRGRSAEGGHPFASHDGKQFRGVELAPEIVDEHGRSGDPLAVHLAPHGLAPARVGHGEMHIARLQIVPVHARDVMSHGVGVGVHDHLGLARGAGGEEDEQRVMASGGILGTGKRVRGSSPRAACPDRPAPGASARRSRRGRSPRHGPRNPRR